jgi:UrcA family protein
MKLIRLATQLSAGLVIAASWMNVVHAADDASESTTIVRLADLNLGSPQDAPEALRRINLAAQAVCPDPASLSGIRANQARYCLAQAVQSAVRRVNSPALTALLLHEHARSAGALLARSTP